MGPLVAAGSYLSDIDPSPGFLPGMLPFAAWMALPASVLAAFLERPFFTRAGVPRNALCFSLKANFLSLAVGFLAWPVALVVVFTDVGYLWMPVSVALTIWVEGKYLELQAAEATRPFRWRWVVVANLWSSAVLLAVPFASWRLIKAHPNFVQDLVGLLPTFTWTSLCASLLLLAAAIAYPVLVRRESSVQDKEEAASNPVAKQPIGEGMGTEKQNGSSGLA